VVKAVNTRSGGPPLALDVASGFYYDPNTGYYFDATTSLYYDGVNVRGLLEASCRFLFF
jgi:hypothetical protein